MKAPLPFKQRLKAYKWLAIQLENEKHLDRLDREGMCDLLNRYIKPSGFSTNPSDYRYRLTYWGAFVLPLCTISTYFPELHEQRPYQTDIGNYSYWFPLDKRGYNKRIKIVEKIISDMERLSQ